jgi:glucan phosphoethanolaminetransferase (alkaline phosphatase superfamily)
MPTETVIFQDEDITITTQRVITHGKTYATAHISSVNSQNLGRGSRPYVGCFLILWGVVAVALFVTVLSDSQSRFIYRLLSILILISVLVIPGILILRSARPKYAVAIVTSGSVVDLSNVYSPLSTRILESDDRDYIQTITENISQAIALRG